VIETSWASSANARVSVTEYVVCAARGIYEIAFLSEAGHAADVARVADNAMLSVSAAPPVRASGNVFNVLGYWTGRLMSLGLLTILLSIGAWWRARRRHMRARREAVDR
jgi:hypothetical protein